jgi:hypothetical protein
MSKIKTFKGKLPIGIQEKIHLSTNDGLTGYRIKQFQIISETPGTVASVTYVAKIYLTDQSGNITSSVDFSDTDLLAVNYYSNNISPSNPINEQIIFDKETFNQDIFIYITDPDGNTTPCNFYIELEQFPIDLNTSTYHTLKNLRSKTQ